MAITKNFIQQWKQVFITEEKVNSNSLKPGNFYKISVYEYSDGVTRSLTGPNIAYIFVIGKFTRNGVFYIACTKLKGIDPKIFFQYLDPALKFRPLSLDKINEVYSNTKSNLNDEFSQLLKPIQPDGKNLFSILKTKKPILDGYREYILKNIQLVTYLDVNPEYLKLKLTKDSKKTKNLKDERDFLNERKAKNAKNIVKSKKEGDQIPNLENKNNKKVSPKKLVDKVNNTDIKK